jgi:hypothetical protein
MLAAYSTRMTFVALQLGGSGLLESVSQLAVIGGTLVLLLGLVAFGAFVYKSVRGDGIRWPDDVDEDAEDGEVRRGSSDDEWEYY